MPNQTNCSFSCTLRTSNTSISAQATPSKYQIDCMHISYLYILQYQFWKAAVRFGKQQCVLGSSSALQNGKHERALESSSAFWKEAVRYKTRQCTWASCNAFWSAAVRHGEQQCAQESSHAFWKVVMRFQKQQCDLGRRSALGKAQLRLGKQNCASERTSALVAPMRSRTQQRLSRKQKRRPRKHKGVSRSSGASWKAIVRSRAHQCAQQKGIKGARATQPHIHSSDHLEETRHVTLRIKTLRVTMPDLCVHGLKPVSHTRKH